MTIQQNQSQKEKDGRLGKIENGNPMFILSKSIDGFEIFMISLIESIIDVGSGFILAILIQLYIFPLFGLYPSILDSIGIALIFTVVSITRSWIWRIIFKKY